jgi:signal peptidase II
MSTIGWIGIFIIAIDAITKYAVQEYLPTMSYGANYYPYGGVGVFQNLWGIEFSLVHQTNRGAAWGVFANFSNHLLLLRIVLIVGMLGYLLFFNKNQSIVLPLTIIAAGAMGNVLDYFLYGHVIDMFHFVLWGYDFPVFNIADTFISLGVFWLCLSTLVTGKKSPKKVPAK